MVSYKELYGWTMDAIVQKSRLQRCTAITTGSDGAIPRSKPFKYTYEKEIVIRIYLLQETGLFLYRVHLFPKCLYRGHARTYLN